MNDLKKTSTPHVSGNGAEVGPKENALLKRFCKDNEYSDNRVYVLPTSPPSSEIPEVRGYANADERLKSLRCHSASCLYAHGKTLRLIAFAYMNFV